MCWDILLTLPRFGPAVATGKQLIVLSIPLLYLRKRFRIVPRLVPRANLFENREEAVTSAR